jgi:hypothetical protein
MEGSVDDALTRAKEFKTSKDGKRNLTGWHYPEDVTPRNEKQCVSLVRAVIPSLPHSSQCREGDPVTPDSVKNLESGTAIATFDNGQDDNARSGNHAANFSECRSASRIIALGREGEPFRQSLKRAGVTYRILRRFRRPSTTSLAPGDSQRIRATPGRRELSLNVGARLAAQPEDDVHLDDFIALRRRDIVGKFHSSERNIRDLPGIFKKEMAMIARIRIENRFCTFDCKPAHDANLGEEIKHIINCRQRSRHFQSIGLRRQGIGGHMPIAFAEEKPRKT